LHGMALALALALHRPSALALTWRSRAVARGGVAWRGGVVYPFHSGSLPSVRRIERQTNSFVFLCVDGFSA
jgi:hypothetical protein